MYKTSHVLDKKRDVLGKVETTRGTGTFFEVQFVVRTVFYDPCASTNLMYTISGTQSRCCATLMCTEL